MQNRKGAPVIADHNTKLTTLEGELRSLANTVAGLASNAEKQWSALGKIGDQLHEVATAVKAAPRFDVNRLIVGAVAVGSLVAMLVGGITYIVSGSQQPQLDRVRSDMRLLEFRLDMIEKRGASPSSFNGGFHASRRTI